MMVPRTTRPSEEHTMAMPELADREDAGIALARYAAGLRFEDLPPEVVSKVKVLILDSFGVAMAGSTAPGIDAAIAAVKGWGDAPQSTLYAHGIKLPAPWAATVNGAMATARDFDDTLDDGMLHTQPSVLPAVLAIAEAEGGHSGRDLITAVAAGAELLCRMGHARRRGQEFLPTGTCAGMAAAAAAARLIQLPFEGVLDACGIAYSQCAANMQPLIEGATIKRFHAGFAARNGIISATLARHGLTGAHNWLEGVLGYYNLYEGGAYEPENLTTELGERHELMDLSIKPWPSARDTHGIVESALALAEEYDLAVGQISEIEAFLVPNAFSLSGKPWDEADGHPVVEAIASAAYCTAVALIRREVILDDFMEKRISDPEVGALASRVKVNLFPDFDDPVSLAPQSLILKLTDGRVLERRIDVLKGHPSRPMSDEEIEGKFRHCCSFAARPVSTERAEAIIHAVRNLEELSEIRELGDLMAL